MKEKVKERQRRKRKSELKFITKLKVDLGKLMLALLSLRSEVIIYLSFYNFIFESIFNQSSEKALKFQYPSQ